METETLKPESASNSVPVHDETTDDLLLSSVDEHENQTSNKILEDLSDLQIDENPPPPPPPQTDLEGIRTPSSFPSIHPHFTCPSRFTSNFYNS